MSYDTEIKTRVKRTMKEAFEVLAKAQSTAIHDVTESDLVREAFAAYLVARGVDLTTSPPTLRAAGPEVSSPRTPPPRPKGLPGADTPRIRVPLKRYVPRGTSGKPKPGRKVSSPSEADAT